MDHYFPDVPGLGNIAVSRHAQNRVREDGISEETFKDTPQIIIEDEKQIEIVDEKMKN